MSSKTYRASEPEIGVVLSLLVVTALLAARPPAHVLVLQLYVLPVVIAGYHFGRTRALVTALTAVALVGALETLDPGAVFAPGRPGTERWLSVGLWGATLLVIGGAVGHLYEARQRAYDELQSAYHGVLEIFSKFIDTADRYTEAHSARVSGYATAVARRIDLGEQEVENVRVAALLHDVGKLDIGGDLLRKAGELTEEEWHRVRRHPALGAQLVGRAGGLLRGAVPLILYHHERVDGSGYYGLRGEEIPIGARVIAVCDAFDAMTTTRAYRAARSTTEALATLRREAGSHFDASIVAAFAAALEEDPELRAPRPEPTAGAADAPPLRAIGRS